MLGLQPLTKLDALERSLNDWLSTEENRWFEPSTNIVLQNIRVPALPRDHDRHRAQRQLAGLGPAQHTPYRVPRRRTLLLPRAWDRGLRGDDAIVYADPVTHTYSPEGSGGCALTDARFADAELVSQGCRGDGAPGEGDEGLSWILAADSRSVVALDARAEEQESQGEFGRGEWLGCAYPLRLGVIWTVDPWTLFWIWRKLEKIWTLRVVLLFSCFICL